MSTPDPPERPLSPDQHPSKGSASAGMSMGDATMKPDEQISNSVMTSLYIISKVSVYMAEWK